MSLNIGLVLFGFSMFIGFMSYVLWSYFRPDRLAKVGLAFWNSQKKEVCQIANYANSCNLEHSLESIRSAFAVPERLLKSERDLPTGWQGWEGGFNPLLMYNSEHKKVVVMLRNGTIMPPDFASELCWFHFDDKPRAGDIVAWRVA